MLKKLSFIVVVRHEDGDKANIAGGRFLLSIKTKGINKEVFKARYVVVGYLDGEKNMLVEKSRTVS